MRDNLCGCDYCAGACEILDEYSIEGNPCEECFREHTEVDEETGEIYPLGTLERTK